MLMSNVFLFTVPRAAAQVQAGQNRLAANRAQQQGKLKLIIIINFLVAEYSQDTFIPYSIIFSF